MNSFWQDLRFGLRTLLKSPGFTAVAVITLALGIGANTAIFSVVNGVLLKPLPYPQPDRIMKVWGHATGLGLPKDLIWFSALEFRELEEYNKDLADQAAIGGASFDITGGGAPEHLEGVQVSPSFFSILGLQPVLGRTFTAEDGQPGHDQVLVLGNGLWKRRFGSDRGVIGRTLDVNGKAMTVVGVLPPGFDYPYQSELWQPLAFTAEDLAPGNRGNHGYEVIARTRPGVTIQQARADMENVGRTILRRNPNYPYRELNYNVLLVPLLEETVGDVQSALWVLVGAVGMVLLIACVNVASLLLARASSRDKEVAIRVALGARRGRIIRQLLTESVLLSGIGGLAGLILAPFALREIIQLGNVALPRLGNIEIDTSVLLFTLLVSIGTGVLFGLAPAWQVVSSPPSEQLNDAGRGSSEKGAKGRLRRLLVVSETALSVILLVGAGLLIHSFLNILAIDPGFHAEKVLTMRMSLPPERYSTPAQISNFYREVVARVDHLPGVESAGAANALPLTNSGSSGTVTIDTNEVSPDQRQVETDRLPVTPGYFEAMGFQLVEGRFFTASDAETSQPVAVVDDTLARTYFGRNDAIGKRVKIGGTQSTNPWLTIVGIVRHIHYRAVEAPSRIQLYWPEAQRPNPTMSLAVRSAVDPLSLAPAVESAIGLVDPDQPVYAVRSLEQLRSAWVSERFLALLLVGIFAGLALVLAAVGIYGVMAYAVTRRTCEIGIRMALGAEPETVMRMVVGDGLALAGIGLAVGIAVSLIVTRLLASMLYGVKASDPLAFGGGAILLLLVAVGACSIPARRAMRVDPIVALRHE
ncbi:MAG TPA: ABC transporter permease [Candidatus Cybelea sp.]|nr:ABC transporter permease [Candidatus Cybelea sp.]